MKRKSLRIKEYDYSSEGIYYVTICSFNREKMFCTIDDKIDSIKFDEFDFEKYIKLTKIGDIINASIKNIENIYLNVRVLHYVIMPNHIHLLLEFEDKPQNENSIKNLSKIIGSMKRNVTKEYNKDKQEKIEIWQKTFYEHVIRNDEECKKIIEYIVYNPLKWKLDEYYK